LYVICFQSVFDLLATVNGVFARFFSVGGHTALSAVVWQCIVTAAQNMNYGPTDCSVKYCSPCFCSNCWWQLSCPFA